MSVVHRIDLPALSQVVEALLNMTQAMKSLMKEDALQWASYTYPALMAFGEVIMVWRLLDLARLAYERSQKKGRKLLDTLDT